MVRINLLKTPGKKRSASRKVPMRMVILPVATLAAGLVVGLAVWGGIRLFSRPDSKAPVRVAAPNKQKGPMNIVEEVVREVHEVRSGTGGGVLRLPYSELSFPEQVNYEINFGKSAIGLMNRIVPEEVEFRRLEFKGFEALYGVGVAGTREAVSSFLGDLRASDGAELLPQPYTNIVRKNSRYQFVFSCRKQFGVNYRAPFFDLGLEFLPARSALNGTIGTILETARESGVTPSGEMKRISAEPLAEYRRFRYSFTARTTYKNAVQFVNTLYDNRVPCAFEHIELIAETDDVLKLESVVLITTLD